MGPVNNGVSRRRLLSAALGTGAVSTLGACSVTGAKKGVTNGESSGSNSGSASGTVNALFMKQAGLNEKQIGKVLDSFKDENPHIEVKPSFVSYEALHDKIVSSAAAGTYDVVLSDVIWSAEFAKKGLVKDVTSKYPDSWDDDMLDGALRTARYNKHYFGVPWYLDAKYLFYNKDMLKKAGVDESALDTWDGVLKASRKIRSKSIVKHPIVWSWSQAEAMICDFMQLVGAWGGSVLNSSGKLTLTDKHVVDAVQWMVDSIKDGLSNPSSTSLLEEDVQKTMGQGKAAFGLNWSSSDRDLRDPKKSNISDAVGVVPTPKGPSGRAPGVNGGMALAIAKKAKNPTGAWRLIKFMTSEKETKRYAVSALPPWKEIYNDKSVTKSSPELFKAAETEFKDLVLRPPVPSYNSVSHTIQVELQKALLRKKSPKQAMADANDKANKHIED